MTYIKKYGLGLLWNLSVLTGVATAVTFLCGAVVVGWLIMAYEERDDKDDSDYVPDSDSESDSELSDEDPDSERRRIGRNLLNYVRCQWAMEDRRERELAG